jgi:hypothetical protein
MLSLTIWASIELLSSAGWSEVVVVGRSKYEAGKCLQGPDAHCENARGLNVAHLVLSEGMHVAGDAL